MKLHRLIEESGKFDPTPILRKLETELAELDIKNPNFQFGFCFHAGARIYDAIRAKYPSHDLKLHHKNGHVFVYDQDDDKSYDSRGEHMGDDPNSQRGKVDHRWKTPADMLKFLHAHEKDMKPESFKGLQVLTNKEK